MKGKDVFKAAVTTMNVENVVVVVVVFLTNPIHKHMSYIWM